jgi:hypothetical protein
MRTSANKHKTKSIPPRKTLIIEVVVVASKESVLEVNAEKTNCMIIQSTGQNQNIKLGIKYFESVGQFSYLGKNTN